MMPYSLVTSHVLGGFIKCLVFVKYVAKNRQSVIPSATRITGIKRFGTPICKAYVALMKKQAR